jgi:2'-5' RNA ligase
LTDKRIQLTLFIDPAEAAGIEKIRKEFNPSQFQLIPAHVTLCREEELESMEKVLQNLAALHHPSISIYFGKPVRFAAGKGALIPALENNEPFQQLRTAVLKGIITKPKKHEPHITLVHPRNATCNNEIFELVQSHTFPKSITFKTISLIEQQAQEPWRLIQKFNLGI